MKNKEFWLGVQAGLPVGIGYFAVSFGFGALAVTKAYGLSAWQAALISLTNVTSAGQFAALEIWKGPFSLMTLWLLFVSQLIINSRYALMSLSLTQRLGGKFGLLQRLIVAFYNTDELFAIAMSRPVALTVPFMYGLGTTPIFGWTLGTLMGGLVSGLLPPIVQTALGVALYGMFVAIVVPQAVAERSKLMVALLGIAFSSVFRFVPFLRDHTPAGLPIIICTVLAAAICAVLFPVEDETSDAADASAETEAAG
ncbi:MAG: AzlC family ABC transporter permease [Clostridia bacterium]|nr:AzlC family ABC transporter permease [Clostridia bacterium]